MLWNLVVEWTTSKLFFFSPEVFGFGSTQIELCSGFLGGIFCLFVFPQLEQVFNSHCNSHWCFQLLCSFFVIRSYPTVSTCVEVGVLSLCVEDCCSACSGAQVRVYLPVRFSKREKASAAWCCGSSDCMRQLMYCCTAVVELILS